MRKNQQPQERSYTSSYLNLTRAIPESLSQLVKQSSIAADVLSKMLYLNVIERIRMMRLYENVLEMALHPVGALLGMSPQPRRRLVVRLLDGIWSRQWLFVIACGTIAVPAAFFTASILEGVALVEYTKLATLSWLSFFVGAVLKKLQKQ